MKMIATLTPLAAIYFVWQVSYLQFHMVVYTSRQVICPESNGILHNGSQISQIQIWEGFLNILSAIETQWNNAAA
jgi:hypothetical protein